MPRMQPNDFFAWIASVTVRICLSRGVLPSVCMAQAAIESGWDQYTIGQYNLFGRKWGGWGNYIETPTREWDGEQYVDVVAKFQDYESLDQAIDDYCTLLIEQDEYSAVLPARDNLELYVRNLADVYATDPAYADAILSTIRANNLREYDFGIASTCEGQ